MLSLILADVLECAGLGGTDPIRAATALLATLRQQPGADEPDHTAAHNAMVLCLTRGMPVASVRAMLADAAPEHVMQLLARLVLAGEPADVIKGYLPRETRRAA